MWDRSSIGGGLGYEDPWGIGYFGYTCLNHQITSTTTLAQRVESLNL